MYVCMYIAEKLRCESTMPLPFFSSGRGFESYLTCVRVSGLFELCLSLQRFLEQVNYWMKTISMKLDVSYSSRNASKLVSLSNERRDVAISPLAKRATNSKATHHHTRCG